MSFGLSGASTAGHVEFARQWLSAVTPHTSGDRPQASPFTIPEKTLNCVSHAPMSWLAVPTSAVTFEMRAWITCGLPARAFVVSAAVMRHTGAFPCRA